MSAEAITIERAAERRVARRPGTRAVYRWELRKLVAQKRTFLGVGAAIAVPLIFIVALLADRRRGPRGRPVRRATSTSPGWRSRSCACSSARSGCCR